MALASGFPCAVLFVAFLCEINFVGAPSPPTHILCVDKDCQGKLGEGVTLQAYAPIVEEFINFGKNEKVTVFGRTEKSDVLHVQVGNKRGYAPENVIKIEKMFVAKEKLVTVEVLPIQSSKAVSEEATQGNLYRSHISCQCSIANSSRHILHHERVLYQCYVGTFYCDRALSGLSFLLQSIMIAAAWSKSGSSWVSFSAPGIAKWFPLKHLANSPSMP